jgi:hypothetical protein
VDAGFTVAAWTTTATIHIDALGTDRWLDTTTDRYARPSWSANLTELEFVSDQNYRLSVASSIKFDEFVTGTTGYAVTNVKNTYGRLYGKIIFKPYGQTFKGTQWAIQSGFNFWELETKDGNVSGKNGAKVLQFGTPDYPLDPPPAADPPTTVEYTPAV